MHQYQLRLFELRYGLPILLRLLRTELNVTEARRFVSGYLRPKKVDLIVAPEAWSERNRELALTQFRSALRLYDALRAAIRDPDRHLRVYTEIVSEIGASFVERTLPMPNREQWSTSSGAERLNFLKTATQRFFNAQAGNFQVTDRSLQFDVTRCQFAELSRGLGRPGLAGAFCQADTLRFARADSLVRLSRTKTLADGGDCCDFRFAYDPLD